LEPAKSEQQVLLPQIARGAGKARLTPAGLGSAGVKMTPLGSKEEPPTPASNRGGQAWAPIPSGVRLCFSKAFTLLICRKMELLSCAFLESVKSANFSKHRYTFIDKQMLL